MSGLHVAQRQIPLISIYRIILIEWEEKPPPITPAPS